MGKLKRLGKGRLAGSRLATDKAYQYKVFCGVGLAIAVIIYGLLYATRVYSMSNGWAYTYYSLMQEGKIPYRDFYYYLPPGNLLINWFIYTISGSHFIIPVYIRMAERILLCEILYSIMVKRVRPLISAMTVFGAMVLAMSRATELGGDYNQTTHLTMALFLLFFLKYVDHIEDGMKKKAPWLLAVGACGGFMFLVKQTIVVSCFIVFLLLLTFLLFANKEKSYITACALVAAGAVIVLLPMFLYLVLNGALMPFVHQVFMDTSAKGDTKTLLAGHLFTFLKENVEPMLAVLALLFLYHVGKKRRPGELGRRETAKTAVYTSLIVFATLLFSHMLFETLWQGLKVTVTSYLIIPLLIVAIFAVVLDERRPFYGVFVFASLCALVWILIFNFGDMTVKIYKNSGLFSSLNTFIGYSFFAVVFWLIYHIIVGLRHHNLALDKIVLACGGIVTSYATLMNNGQDNVSNGSAYFLMPALAVILFENIDYDSLRARTYTKFITVAMLCILCVSASQKLVCPYSWWGYTAEDFWSKTETSSYEELKGYKMSELDIQKYDRLLTVIRDNTDEDSVIFGFPYVKCYNAILGNFNMDNFVPVLFYDTCADSYARADAKLLAENQPDIVVWLDVPNCMETHERMFRGGQPLGQRDIQKWFSKAKKTDYTLIGQVDNLFVYKLTADGQSVTSTYIRNKTKPNTTAEYVSKSSKKKTTTKKKKVAIKVNLSGGGTQEDPYLITNRADLQYLRDTVNAGTEFSNYYFLQTADIDLKDVESWEPIASYDCGYSFAGFYNGNGYEIQNMTIDAEDENVGLFGRLDGAVINLNLVNCDINGMYVGAITSHGNGPVIANCYVSGKLHGSHRVGGIADNAGAKIYNCVVDAEITGDSSVSGISGYYRNTPAHCYSSLGDAVGVDEGKPLGTIDEEDMNTYSFPKSKKFDPAELNTWVQDEDGTWRVSHELR